MVRHTIGVLYRNVKGVASGRSRNQRKGNHRACTAGKVACPIHTAVGSTVDVVKNGHRGQRQVAEVSNYNFRRKVSTAIVANGRINGNYGRIVVYVGNGRTNREVHVADVKENVVGRFYFDAGSCGLPCGDEHACASGVWNVCCNLHRVGEATVSRQEDVHCAAIHRCGIGVGYVPCNCLKRVAWPNDVGIGYSHHERTGLVGHVEIKRSVR